MHGETWVSEDRCVMVKEWIVPAEYVVDGCNLCAPCTIIAETHAVVVHGVTVSNVKVEGNGDTPCDRCFSMSIATRESPDDVWGPPVTLRKERNW
jgi:hypothetical protein